MTPEEDAKIYYKKNYQNEKEGTSLNINKQLWINYQEFCLKLSKKTKKKVTASSRIRILMIKDILENKDKINSN